MKILWIAGESFEPLDSGLYIYSKTLHDISVDLGHEVWTVARRRGEASSDSHTVLVEPISTRNRIVQHLRGAPVKIAAIQGSDYHAAVKSVVQDIKPDLVVIDHLRAASAINVIPDDLPVLYASQNNETKVRDLSISESGHSLRSLALRIDRVAVRRWEQRLVGRAAAISVISDQDQEIFKANHNGLPTTPIVTVPPAYRGPCVEAREIDDSTPRRVTLVTDLRWRLKADNTEELLRELAPRASKAGVAIHIAGPGQEDGRLAGLFPSVNFDGFVDDLAAYLAQARMGIIYEPRGGGVKLKSLDYVFNRVPIVARPGDLVGLPLLVGKTTLGGDDVVAYVDSCLSTIDDLARLNELHNAAYDVCDGVFSMDTIAHCWADALAATVS